MRPARKTWPIIGRVGRSIWLFESVTRVTRPGVAAA